MHTTTTILVALIAYANAHALITSPPIRTPGPNHLQTCGQASFNRLKLDASGHIEEQQPVNPGCELTLCRGMLFSDQPSTNIQRLSPGQSMTMDIDCTIPHGGPANVSLVDTTGGGSGRVIGSFLKTFNDFCPVPGPAPADQMNLQFNLPPASVIGNNCKNDGQCVVQLFWATPDFSQNYYYCIDVTMKALVVNLPPPATSAPTSPAAPIAPATSSSLAASDAGETEITTATPTSPSASPSRMATVLSTPIGDSAHSAPPQRIPNRGSRRLRLLWF